MLMGFGLAPMVQRGGAAVIRHAGHTIHRTVEQFYGVGFHGRFLSVDVISCRSDVWSTS
jgi:hypothetical protein